MIPMVGAVAGVGGAIASAAAGAAMSGAAGLSGMVKAKSELTFAYELAAPGNTAPVFSKSLKAKAKTDGEDLITPMVTQAAAGASACVRAPGSWLLLFDILISITNVDS